MITIRTILVLLALAAIGLPMLAVQSVLHVLKLPAARVLPMYFHRITCALLGLKVERIGQLAHPGPALVVSNHSSWLDIVIIGSLAPLSFVAKKEVASWPLFGLMAKLQNTIFIDRNRRRGTHEASDQMAERLAAGEIIVLFAEGTSSDGNRVLPFRSAVIGAIERAAVSHGYGEVPAQPMALACTAMRGLPVNRHERASLSWFGDMALLPHMWYVLRSLPLDYTVSIGEPLQPGNFADRKALTRALEVEVRRRFHSVLHHRELAAGDVRMAGGMMHPACGTEVSGTEEAAQTVLSAPESEYEAIAPRNAGSRTKKTARR